MDKVLALTAFFIWMMLCIGFIAFDGDIKAFDGDIKKRKGRR